MLHFLLFLRKNKPEYEISHRGASLSRLNLLCLIPGGYKLSSGGDLPCALFRSTPRSCPDIPSSPAVGSGRDGFIWGAR